MTDTHTTAHLPDEAVRAGALALRYSGSDTLTDMAKTVLAAALPHLSAPCAVEVKKLEWHNKLQRGEREGFICSTGGILSYLIMLSRFRVYGIEGEHDGAAEFKTLDEAKAAAQADFERHILSCVVTKPVDVAAVRRQAIEKAATLLDEGFEMPVEKAWRNDGQPSKNDKCPHDKFMYEDCMICASAAIRALSAEPVQRDQWQPIETAPKDGARFLATLSNGWIVILSETGQDRYAWYQTSSKIHIPVARTHPRDSLKESILATHWMPLPAAPTTEAGK